MFWSPVTVDNCVRLVDEGSRVCKLIIDIHKEGKASSLQNLEEGLQLWKSIADNIPPDLFPESERSSSAEGPTSAELQSPGVKAADGIASAIGSTAAEIQQTAALLQKEIDRLQIEPNQRWESVKTAIKTRWKDSRFQQLQEQFQNCRDRLMHLIWISLPKTQQILQARTEGGLSEIKKSLEAILQELHVHFPKTSAEGRERVAEQLGNSLGMYESMCTESLNFGILSNRENTIAEYEPDTLPWLLDEPSTGESRNTSSLKDNARHFLRREIVDEDSICLSPQSLFFIIGKAGSGKSTAMKALCNDPRIRDDLVTWAGTGHVLAAKFYFSYKGTDLQKSLRGLIRALLYQCLEKERVLIHVTIPQNAELDTPEQLRRYWTLDNLKKAFNDMLTHGKEKMNLKFCFFIDGLDECTIHADPESPHSPVEGIMNWLTRMARHSNTKFCVSSRPEQPFQNVFETFPGFQLQDRTRKDIRKYAEHRLGSNSRLRALQEQEKKAGVYPSTLEVLIDGISNNAEGVFLWVVLAIESLKQRIGNHDSRADLIEALNELPKGLERLYTHILEKVDEQYLKEGIKYMLMVEAAGGSIPFQHLAYAVACDTRSSKTHPDDHRDQVRRSLQTRIDVCCMGLVETRSTPTSSGLGEEIVSFLHKSVQDFLKTDALIKLDTTWNTTWVAEHKLLRGYLEMIRSKQWSSFGCNIIKHHVWVDQIKPIVAFYVLAARRAARLRKPASYNSIRMLYNVADDLWDQVSGKRDAESSKRLHWSKASHAPVASKDVLQTDVIRNVEDFIKHYELRVGSQSTGSQSHRNLTVGGSCALDPAEHLNGPSSEPLIITKLSRRDSDLVQQEVVGQESSLSTGTEEQGQFDGGRHARSSSSNISLSPPTKKMESDDGTRQEREKEARRNRHRSRRQQELSTSTNSNGAGTAKQECAKPTTEKPPSGSPPPAARVKEELPISGPLRHHDRPERKPEVNENTKRSSPRRPQCLEGLQEMHELSVDNLATLQREIAESRSSPSVKPLSSWSEVGLCSVQMSAPRPKRRHLEQDSSLVDVELTDKPGKKPRSPAARREAQSSHRRRRTDRTEATPGLKNQSSPEITWDDVEWHVHEQKRHGASRRCCIIL